MKSIIKYLILVFIVLGISFYELPYYIDAPGGLDNLNDKIKIDDGYDSQGSINLTYVREVKGTIPLLIYAKLNPDWVIHSKKESNIGSLDYDSLMIREQILMKQSYTSAIKFAYEAADKEVNIQEEKCYVIYVFEDADVELEVGDQILKIDDNKVEKCSDLATYTKTKKENEESKIIVLNNEKEYIRNIKYTDFDGTIAIGIQVGTVYSLTTKPEYNMKFSENEYGPSGGLMIALAVYNKLVEEDITGGYKIAGTGTLNANGEVGPIGGIEFKLKGAAKSKAKVFFAPSGENYEDAIKLKEEKKYDIDVVEVKTFQDALDYLEEKYVN